MPTAFADRAFLGSGLLAISRAEALAEHIHFASNADSVAPVINCSLPGIKKAEVVAFPKTSQVAALDRSAARAPKVPRWYYTQFHRKTARWATAASCSADLLQYIAGQRGGLPEQVANKLI